MDTAVLVLIILAIIYVPIWIWVWRKPEEAAKFHLVKYGPTIMIKTRLGIETMDKMGKYRRFWRVVGFLSRFVSVILFFLMMYMLIVALIALPTRIGSGGIGIQYALAIPGFNPMLPLTYGIVALFFAMVVHEMGHGIQSRANDCTVDSTGLLYGVVPLGAFCEPNEEELNKLDRRAQMDIFSAGIAINTFWAIVAFSIMLLLFTGISVADYGQGDGEELPGVYYIDAGSPAYDSGVPTSALITGVREYDETSYSPVHFISGGGLSSFVTDSGTDERTLYYIQYQLADGLHETTTPIQLGALIKSVTNNSPAKSAGLEPLTYLDSITFTRGDAVWTVDIDTPVDFREAMAESLPGDLAQVTTVTVAVDGDVTTIETVEHEAVSLTASGSKGYLGLGVTTAGFTVTTPSVMRDKAVDPFIGCSSPIDYVEALFQYLAGPVNGLDPISDSITWWYDTSLGDITWVLVKLMYWIFWLDILLAISNALPAYPFDGGFLFEGAINWILELVGIRDKEKRKELSDKISGTISNVVLIMFALVLLAFLI
jgi:membrane-associated protease RseP (regulator of RpoE activity)